MTEEKIPLPEGEKVSEERKANRERLKVIRKKQINDRIEETKIEARK